MVNTIAIFIIFLVFLLPSIVQAPSGYGFYANGSAWAYNDTFLDNFSDNGRLSFYMWLNTAWDENSSGVQTVWEKQQDANDFTEIVFDDAFNGALHFNMIAGGSASGRYLNTSKVDWDNETWYNITVEWGSGGFKIFVDGVEEDSDANTGSMDDGTSGDFVFGQSFRVGGRNFDGAIDDVILTADTPTVSTHWLFDEGSGTFTEDNNSEWDLTLSAESWLFISAPPVSSDNLSITLFGTNYFDNFTYNYATDTTRLLCNVTQGNENVTIRNITLFTNHTGTWGEYDTISMADTFMENQTTFTAWGSDFGLRKYNISHTIDYTRDSEHCWVGKANVSGMNVIYKCINTWDLDYFHTDELVRANLHVYIDGDNDNVGRTEVYIYHNFTQWNLTWNSCTDQEWCWNLTEVNRTLIGNWSNISSYSEGDYSYAFNITQIIEDTIAHGEDTFTLLITSQYESNLTNDDLSRMYYLGAYDHGVENYIEYTYNNYTTQNYTAEFNATLNKGNVDWNCRAFGNNSVAYWGASNNTVAVDQDFELRLLINGTSTYLENYTITFTNASTETSFVNNASSVTFFNWNNATSGISTINIFASGYGQRTDNFNFADYSWFNRTYYVNPAGLFITLADQETQSVLNGTVYVSNDTSTVTFPNITSISAGWDTLPQGSITIRLEAENYTDSYYYDTMNQFAFVNYTAYLLHEDDATEISFFVFYQDNSGTTIAIEDAQVSAYRNLADIWTLIGERLTDGTGIGTMYLDRTVTYRIEVSASGFETNSTLITPTQSLYNIRLTPSTAINISFDYGLRGINYLFSPPPYYTSTTQINFTLSDANASLEYYGFTIFANGTQIFTTTVNGDSDGGIINGAVDLSGYAGTYLNLTGFWKKEGYAEFQVYDIREILEGDLFSDSEGATRSLIDSITQIPKGARLIIAIFIMLILILGLGQFTSGSGLLGVIFLGFMTAIGWFTDIQYWTSLYILMVLTMVSIYMLRSRW